MPCTARTASRGRSKRAAPDGLVDAIDGDETLQPRRSPKHTRHVTPIMGAKPMP
jgi:hypothetical protein